MSFAEWLVENGHVSSTDRETIESELSSYEVDQLYEIYLNEGNSE